MHQPVGEFPIGGEQHQAGGIDVQPPNGNPAMVTEPGKAVEYRRSSFRVSACGDLAFRFVVDEYTPDHLGPGRNVQALAIQLNAIINRDFLPRLNRIPIDAQATGFDPGLNFPTRSHTGSCQ